MKKTVIAMSLSTLIFAQPLLASEKPEPIGETSLKATASGMLMGDLLAGLAGKDRHLLFTPPSM
jgi:phosphatidylglycerophosphatase A